MFHGSIPQDVRSMAHEITAAWACTDVYVACSGNFTMERVLHTLDRFRIHANDIQIYSCALGAYFAGQPLTLSFKPDLLTHMPFIARTIATPADQLATLFMAVLHIFMQHRDDLACAYLSPDGDALSPRQRVPLSSVLPLDTIPAALAARLRRVLARIDADHLTALDKLVALAETSP